MSKKARACAFQPQAGRYNQDYPALANPSTNQLLANCRNPPFALRLCLYDILTPYISCFPLAHSLFQPTWDAPPEENSHSVPPHQHRISIRPLLNRLLQTLPQILLFGRVFDNRYPQSLEIPQVPRPLRITSRDPFDLFDAFDLEDVRAFVFAQQGYEDRVDGVGVDAAAGVSQRVGGHEERGAGRGFEDLFFSNRNHLSQIPCWVFAAVVD